MIENAKIIKKSIFFITFHKMLFFFTTNHIILVIKFF